MAYGLPDAMLDAQPAESSLHQSVCGAGCMVDHNGCLSCGCPATLHVGYRLGGPPDYADCTDCDHCTGYEPNTP